MERRGRASVQEAAPDFEGMVAAGAEDKSGPGVFGVGQADVSAARGGSVQSTGACPVRTR